MVTNVHPLLIVSLDLLKRRMTVQVDLPSTSTASINVVAFTERTFTT